MSLSTSEGASPSIGPYNEREMPDPCPNCSSGVTCRYIGCGRLAIKNGADPKLVRIVQLEKQVLFLEDTLAIIEGTIRDRV